MKKDILGKALVLGVICLFVGTCIQPAYAIEIIPKAGNKTESVEDCDCQEIDSQTLIRVKLLITQLKITTNILLLKFGHIPKVAVVCNEALEQINSINPTETERPICDALEEIAWAYGNSIVDSILAFFFSLFFYVDLYKALKEVMNIISSFIFLFITVLVGTILLCSWVWEEPQNFNIFESRIGLELQRIQDSFSDLV
jgi:hypothetical protein